jgi:histidine triad (HIT) family protein
MTQKIQTIFEKIIAREIPAHIMYEDDVCIAFLDIAPTTKGHTLVVPKKAYVNIFDIDATTLSYIIEVTQKLARHIVQKLGAQGANIVHNAGSVAEQIVPHFHIHIVPRYETDQFKLWSEHKCTSASLKDVRDIITQDNQTQKDEELK